MVITWRTKKVIDGFEFRVFTVEYNKPSTILKTGKLSTRARAVNQAKKWTRYIKHNKKDN